MDQLLTNFIRALRNADIRISTAETLDAFSAIQLVGYRDRQLLKDSLALVLPKTPDEKAAFDTCFDQFFSFRERRALPAPSGEVSSADGAAGALPGNGEAGGSGDSQGRRTGGGQGASEAVVVQEDGGEAELLGSGEMSAPTSALGQMLVRANTIEINIAITAAGQQVKVHEIEVFTQKGVYTRRILDAMGH